MIEPDANTVNWVTAQKKSKVNAQHCLTELLRMNGNPRSVVPLLEAVRSVYGTSMEGILGMLRESRRILQDPTAPLATVNQVVEKPKPVTAVKTNYFKKRPAA